MDQIIQTNYGKVRGVQEGSCMAFKNIPYAKPPVGELRFRRPVEPDPWEGELDCTAFGKIAMQKLPGNEQPWEKLYFKEFYSDPAYLREMSEDCLNLNIWTPAKTPEDKLPVAFWIHGGGFAGGYSSEIEFGAEAFGEQGVILVTIEYRCGPFGFLAHPWLSEEDEKGISGNYGIFDQIAALRWVYENIAAFGGDPENITIFGQSAGCMSVQILISSELTGHMIAKAILQSGVEVNGGFHAAPTLEEEEQYGQQIAEMAGVHSLEELRQLPAEKLLQAKEDFDRESFRYMMEHPEEEGDALRIVPNVDGYLLQKNIRKLFHDGRVKPIPYMAGCTMDDLGTTEEDRKNKTPGMLLQENKAFCKGVSEMFGKDAYCYLFARTLPGSVVAPEAGEDIAFHSAELWYMFGTLGRCWRPMTEKDFALSREMVRAWADFMKTGKPGLDWKPCTAEHPAVKVFE